MIGLRVINQQKRFFGKIVDDDDFSSNHIQSTIRSSIDKGHAFILFTSQKFLEHSN